MSFRGQPKARVTPVVVRQFRKTGFLEKLHADKNQNYMVNGYNLVYFLKYCKCSTLLAFSNDIFDADYNRIEYLIEKKKYIF